MTMKSIPLIAMVATYLSLGSPQESKPSDARSVVDAAAAAMGATSLQSIEYSGTGLTFPLGQSPGPGKPWPRFKVIKYVAVVNFNAPAMREELVRTGIDALPRGGGAGPYNAATGQGGIRPIPFGPQTQTQNRDARNEVGLVQIWMTPHGFLKAAGAKGAAIKATAGTARTGRALSLTVLGKYTLTATINDRHLVERVETRIPSPVLGDMLIESIYSDYADHGGVKFPGHIVQRQGGHPTLDLTVDQVRPNSATALDVGANLPRAPGPPPPARVEAQEIAKGVWFLNATPPVSVLVEFNDHLVVVEAPNGDERTTAALAEVKRVAPNKPIRFVVNTHHHFDHAGGVRGIVAEGIPIITHQLNKPYFERIFKNPFQLTPDRLARSPRNAVIEGVSDKRVLTDGARTLELHHIRGNLHDEAMLMAYLPQEKLLIQADALNPRPGGRPLEAPSPFSVNLYENVQRLKLDVAQIVHIHGGLEPFEVLKKAAGR